MNLKKPVATFLTLASLLVPNAAFAVDPDEILKDPAMEARARNISAGLRCVVCQNQSIDDSNASVAKDLRVLIREQLLQNKTDEEVVRFVEDRYGDYVLLKPRFKPSTYILWFAPFLALAAGVAYVMFRKNKPGAAGAEQQDRLTEAERVELEELLGK